MIHRGVLAHWLVLLCLACSFSAAAQTPPSARDVATYPPLFLAVVNADETMLQRAIASAEDIDARDDHGRSALHVAAFYANHAAMRALIAAGADANALENDYYDIATIAAVADDVDTLRLALRLGCSPANVTSRYRGTALIAAAHLGHVEVVEALIAAGAPLDHVNNLGWTALIESIVLGDGGARHSATLQALVEAGADVNLADGSGQTPLQLATERGYTGMARILRSAGGK
jgi:ankyrin repeat protein